MRSSAHDTDYCAMNDSHEQSQTRALKWDHSTLLSTRFSWVLPANRAWHQSRCSSASPGPKLMCPNNATFGEGPPSMRGRAGMQRKSGRKKKAKWSSSCLTLVVSSRCLDMPLENLDTASTLASFDFCKIGSVAHEANHSISPLQG